MNDQECYERVARVFPMALGQDASETEKFDWKEERGLNDPLVVQYFNYMKKLVCGDFGNSYSDGRPITQSIVSRWPTTIVYATVSLLIASVFGIALGVLSAVKRGKFFDSIMFQHKPFIEEKSGMPVLTTPEMCIQNLKSLFESKK